MRLEKGDGIGTNAVSKQIFAKYMLKYTNMCYQIDCICIKNVHDNICGKMYHFGEQCNIVQQIEVK